MQNDDDEYADLRRAKTQQDVLIKILSLSPEGTRSPTIRELTQSLGKAADSNVVRALDELEKKGYIHRDRADTNAAQARGIWLTRRGFDWLTAQGLDTSRYTRIFLVENEIRVVPVYGDIAAGNPRSTGGPIVNGNVQEYVPLPAHNLPINDVFLLNVVGNSMIGDGILDGDQVIVVPYEDPKASGEIVVALVDGDATVKRLSWDGSKYWLHPSNPDFQPRDYSADDELFIQGRVAGLVRWQIR
jgi:repressor LexA